MQFLVEHRVGYVQISATGRLDMMGAPQLREVTAEVFAGGAHRVVVDLGDTGFMDSSGLGALIGSLKIARQAGGDLRIANVSPPVRMVLELTNMNRVLIPYATAETAYTDA